MQFRRVIDIFLPFFIFNFLVTYAWTVSFNNRIPLFIPVRVYTRSDMQRSNYVNPDTMSIERKLLIITSNADRLLK